MYLVRIAAKGTNQPRSNRRSILSRARTASTFALAVVALGSLAGCGNTYRPVVSSINPVGPAGQPQKFAVAVSSPSSTTPGIVTFVDFSGDSVLITANLGLVPYWLSLNGGGTTGYTLNQDGTLTSFDISTQLQTRDVLQTTLLSGANPGNIFVDSRSTYITEPGRNAVAQLQGSPSALKQEFPIATGYSPVYIAGFPGSARAYIINQSTSGGNGQVVAIESSSSSLSNTLPVGHGPVYGVMTADGKRAFIMNKTDGTVSVINAQTNALDTAPAGSTNPIVVGTAPLWADLAPTLNELVVANAGDGTNPGSVSIINIPLCSASALSNNPNCDANNPVDANGFGQVLANVKVGVNPLMVAVLQDGSKAYVINQHDSTVSVINLTYNTVTATIPVPRTPNPTFIAATTGTPTGKVYVTSPTSNTMTVIRTDTDAVETTVDLQGKGVMVRVTQP
ncbi:YncE family protein [Edaphobacter bradus]|uniref:YncE family protein n=1 Tax=Edaphobacter bradus TaxID=2259016 RepID=UPI0021E0D33E|nr:YncE family protein [Edaphobacter bradus]